MDKAYADIARSINVPGFRRGKVPPMVIDQRFGRGVVIQEAFNDSWSRFYGEAVTANQLTPLAQPDVEVTKLEDGDLIEFTAEVDVRPDFEVPDASAIEVQVDALDVPESLVDEQLDVLRRRFGSRTTVERPAADGDPLTLSLVATNAGGPLPAPGRPQGAGSRCPTRPPRTSSTRSAPARCWTASTRPSPACRRGSPRRSP